MRAVASSTTSSAKERLCLGHFYTFVGKRELLIELWRALQLLRQKRDCAWGTGELYNFVGKRELLIESCGELYNFFGNRDLLIESCGELYTFLGKREIVLGALASSTTSSAKENF